MFNITVIYPNRRRTTVKAEPSKTLFQVLDEACKKQGYLTERYALVHNSTPLELSLTLRLSNVPSMCTLEIIENQQNEKQQIEVALQLMDGQRCKNYVPSNAALIDILLDFESTYDLKLLDCGEETDMHPACLYLNHEFIGLEALSAVTLKSLGIQDRALFKYTRRKVSKDEMTKINEELEKNRVKQRKLDATFRQKFKEASDRNNVSVDDVPVVMDTVNENQPFQSISAAENLPSHSSSVDSVVTPQLDRTTTALGPCDPVPQQPSQQPSVTLARNEFANFKFPEHTKGVDLRDNSSNSLKAEVEPCERRTTVYHINDSLNIGNIEEPPAEFYELTVDDLKSQIESLRKQSQDSFALLSKEAVLQKNRELMENAYKYSVVRVQFVDGTIVQGTFFSLEKVSVIYRFVQSLLNQDSLGFDLIAPVNRRLADMEQTLLQADLAPRVLLIFKCRKEDAVKLKDCLEKLSQSQYRKSQAEAELTAQECLLQNSPFVGYQPPRVTVETPAQARSSDYSSQERSNDAGAKSTLPKWMKR